MLKRVGVLALILSAGAAFLQPAAAFAEERSHPPAYSVERGYNSRSVREYREPVRRDNDDRAWREHGRIEYRNERGYYAPAPTYYYAPAPNCGYRY